MDIKTLNKAKNDIEKLLNMSAMSHQAQVYKIGLQWLEINFKHNSEQRRYWEGSPVFWSWWKLKWNMRSFELVELFKVIKHTQRQMVARFEGKHKECLSQFPPRPIVNKIKNTPIHV